MLLGVTIDNNLTFSPHIKFALSKICARKIARPAQNSTLRLNFMRRLLSPNLTIVILSELDPVRSVRMYSEVLLIYLSSSFIYEKILSQYNALAPSASSRAHVQTIC